MYLIGDGLLITRDDAAPVIENGAVATDGNTVVRVGKTAELKELYPAAEFIDAEGGIIMPGLIDAHSHLTEALLLGFAPDAEYEPSSRLSAKRADAESKFGVADCACSAYASLTASLRCGVTTVFDLDRVCSAKNGVLLGIAGAAELLGMRLGLANAVTERCGYEGCTVTMTENESLISLCASSGSPLIRPLYGLDALYSVPDIDVARCVNGNGGRTGFYATVSEDPCDNYICSHAYGKTPVQRLFELGALDERAVLAHCTHMEAADMELISRVGCFAVHTPLADLLNAVGRAPVIEMLSRGIKLCLGTDGVTSDLLACAKASVGLIRSETGDPSAGTEQTAKMLFGNNRKLASACFGKDIGVLREGAAADIVIMEHAPFTPLSADSADAHVILGAQGGCCSSAVIEGRLVMRNRRILTVNEALIRERARVSAEKLWERIRSNEADEAKLQPIHWSFT